MKESEKIYKECQQLLNSLNSCIIEYGWKGRLFNYCGDYERQLNKCKQRHRKGKKIKTQRKYLLNMSKKFPEIEESFEKQENYPSVTERYYKQLFFSSDKGPPLEHHCVLVHSNKICLVTLATSHPVVSGRKKISRLDFQVSDKLDRLENKVSGKGKKGGQHITPDSVLCFVECDDGTRYTVWGCVKGKLVEINSQLLTRPELLSEKPLSQGYVAVILPSLKDSDAYKSRLLTREKYESDLLTAA